MLFAGLLPPQYAVYRDALVFVILILVLLVRPNGLMGARSGGGGASMIVRNKAFRFWAFIALPILLIALADRTLPGYYVRLIKLVGINIILASSLSLCKRLHRDLLDGPRGLHGHRRLRLGAPHDSRGQEGDPAQEPAGLDFSDGHAADPGAGGRRG